MKKDYLHGESVAAKCGSNGGTGWVSIPKSKLSEWNKRLLETDAHYRQYPYWCEPYGRNEKFLPHFYSYYSKLEEIAYVCILERIIFGIKIGLIFRGPVGLGRNNLHRDIVADLIRMAKHEGYAFLRFTHQSEELFDQLLEFDNATTIESFPLYRDPPKSLLVTQSETDAETLASFQAVARRNIRAGKKAGYVINRFDSPEEYRKVWPMFERLADKKGFELSSRPLDTWIEVIGSAHGHGCSALYTACLDGVCVSAIHLLRYGSTAEFMLGALDLELLGSRPSPSALLHWVAMRDLHRSGCRHYNLGGPGDGKSNKVYQFKRKFRPELTLAQPPVTVILVPLLYGMWNLAVLKGWFGLAKQIRRVRGKCRDLINRTIEKLDRGR